MSEDPKTPQDVWSLIERADELVKYAPNRDQAAAYAQARATLEKAAEAARAVPGAEALEKQALRRLDDLANLESGAGA